MVKRVIWSRKAIADRISILDYWQKRIGSTSYSARLDTETRRVVKMIAQYPAIGRTLEGRHERFFVISHYLIVYAEKPDRIEILHVWDSRRNPVTLIP